MRWYYFKPNEIDEIYRSVASGKLDKLKTLLEIRGDDDKNPVIHTDPDGTEWTVLHRAAFYGHVNIIKYFENELGFDNVNPQNKTNGRTPFEYAVEFKKSSVVDYYIENGYTYPYWAEFET